MANQAGLTYRKKGLTLKQKTIAGVIIMVVLIGVIASSSGGKNTISTKPATTSKATQTSGSTAKAAPRVATRQVAGTATTLGTGTFAGGQDVAVGLYDVTPGAGQSGNFMVGGADSYNEILGGDSSLGGVPSVTVSLTKGDTIEISSLSQVTFTPKN